ncbi:hypothetical protein DN069_10310 [Streptacidiphilus pinicola]|uniref:Uncharacterized protein n=1 Tax=Streptacidiphilus pinicola TaxID=2219663 RepID=A0A2X0JDD0_9ACTN|nr:hypothetical protein [Streptacidiphilus pinicola]RAG85638.1 hypothetical protein DN069_10310 [Streptacidiphilus pinicola]
MSDQIAAWLQRTLQRLQDAERDLAEERRRGAALRAENGTLRQRLAAAESRVSALQILAAGQGVPEPVPVPCRELRYERPVMNVAVGDLL